MTWHKNILALHACELPPPSSAVIFALLSPLHCTAQQCIVFSSQHYLTISAPPHSCALQDTLALSTSCSKVRYTCTGLGSTSCTNWISLPQELYVSRLRSATTQRAGTSITMFITYELPTTIHIFKVLQPTEQSPALMTYFRIY